MVKSDIWGWNFVWGWNRLGVEFRPAGKSQQKLNLAKVNTGWVNRWPRSDPHVLAMRILMSHMMPQTLRKFGPMKQASCACFIRLNIEFAILIATHYERYDDAKRFRSCYDDVRMVSTWKDSPKCGFYKSLCGKMSMDRGVSYTVDSTVKHWWWQCRNVTTLRARCQSLSRRTIDFRRKLWSLVWICEKVLKSGHE